MDRKLPFILLLLFPHYNPFEIIPDRGGRQDERVNPVKHSTMSRKNHSRILDGSAPFPCRFEEIADLSSQTADSSHSQHVCGGNFGPVSKNRRHEQGAQKIRSCSLPGFVWADFRGHLPPPESAANEIRRGISNPNQDHCKKKKPGTNYIDSVQANHGTERKDNEYQSGGTHGNRSQYLGERARAAQGDCRHP